MRTNWTKEEIKVVIMRNDSQCCKALIELYNRQTADEQASGETNHQNGAGFNGLDAGILSSFAEFYLNAGFLTPRQMAVLRRKIGKYCGQLARIANGEL